MSSSYHFLFKYIIVGDPRCGKSCLLFRFTEGGFQESYNITVGVEFGTADMKCEGKDIKLQIWDTAGQENFKSITRSYYRGSAGCLLVFDMTREETFQHCKKWLEEARTYSSDTLLVMLVGNKSDLKETRKVSALEAQEFAVKNSLLYMETSAKDGSNVEETFQEMTREILLKIKNGDIDIDFGEEHGIETGKLFKGNRGNREDDVVDINAHPRAYQRNNDDEGGCPC